MKADTPEGWGRRASRLGRNVYILRLRSLFDVLWYNYFVLSRRFGLWAACTVAIFVLTLLLEQFIGEIALVGLLLPPVIAAGASALVRRDRPVDVAGIESRVSAHSLDRIKAVKPTQREEAAGFKTMSLQRAPDGPIVISYDFNAATMARAEWDPILRSETGDDKYWTIVEALRDRAPLLRSFLWRKFTRAFWTDRPLINEGKVGFASRLEAGSTEVELYRTDYFTGMCTADLSVRYLRARNGSGAWVTHLDGLAEGPFQQEADGQLRALEFDDTGVPCSIHGGVEVLAVSADFWLRLGVQNKHAQMSEDMRAPTGSGSMDWGDVRGSRTLKQLISRSAARELLEENAYGRKSRKVRIERLEPIGYFRVPHRGGKPQFVCLAKFATGDANLQPDPTELDLDASSAAAVRFKVSTFAELSKALDAILAGGSLHYDSVALFGAAMCLRGAIERSPDLICDILGYEREAVAAPVGPKRKKVGPRTRRLPHPPMSRSPTA